MKQAGKIHWMVLIGVAGVIAIVVLLFFGREGPEQAAGRFMSALAVGDAKRLTDLSYYPDGDREKLLKQWEFATQVAGKNYQFHWNINFAKASDKNSASVKMEVIRNSTDSQNSFPENYQLPMVMDKGKWYVDVRGISRTLYPAVPR